MNMEDSTEELRRPSSLVVTDGDDDDDRSDEAAAGCPVGPSPHRVRSGRRRREAGGTAATVVSTSPLLLPLTLLLLLLLLATPAVAKLTVIDPISGRGVVDFETLPASFGRRFMRGDSYLAVLRLPPNVEDDPYLCGTSQRRELGREDDDAELERDLLDGEKEEGSSEILDGLLRGARTRSLTDNDPADSFAQWNDTEDFLRPRPVDEGREPAADVSPSTSSNNSSSSSSSPVAAIEDDEVDVTSFYVNGTANATTKAATKDSSSVVDQPVEDVQWGQEEQEQTQTPRAPTRTVTRIVEVPVALLVRRGMCSFGAKAQTALTVDLNGNGSENDDGNDEETGGDDRDDESNGDITEDEEEDGVEEQPPSNATAPKETTMDMMASETYDTRWSDDVDVDDPDQSSNNDGDGYDPTMDDVDSYTYDSADAGVEVTVEYKLVVRYMIVYNNNPTEDLVVMASPWGPEHGDHGLDLGMLFVSHDSGLRLLAALTEIEEQAEEAAATAAAEEGEDEGLFVKTNSTTEAAGTSNPTTTPTTASSSIYPHGGLVITMDSTIPSRFSQYGFGWWGGNRTPHADANGSTGGRFRSTRVMIVLRYVLLSFLVLLPCLRGLCLYVAVRRRNADIARRRLRGENVRDYEDGLGGGSRFELVFVRTGSPRRREEEEEDNRLTREEVLALPEIVHGSGKKKLVKKESLAGAGEDGDVNGFLGLEGGPSVDDDDDGFGGRGGRGSLTDTTVDDDTAALQGGDVDASTVDAAAVAAEAVGEGGGRGDDDGDGDGSSIPDDCADDEDEEDMGLYLIFGSGSGEDGDDEAADGGDEEEEDEDGGTSSSTTVVESPTAAVAAILAGVPAPPPAVESAPSDELRHEVMRPPLPLMSNESDDDDHDDDHDLELGNVATEEAEFDGEGQEGHQQYYEHASCSVCLDDFEDGETLRVLPCGHSFHDECILPWLTERQGCCPLCKTPVVVERRRPDEEAAGAGDDDEAAAEDPMRSRVPTTSMSPTTPPSSSLSPPSPPLMDMYTPPRHHHHPNPPAPAAENAALWFFSPPPFVNRSATGPTNGGGSGSGRLSFRSSGAGNPRRSRSRHGRRLPRNPFPFTQLAGRYGATASATSASASRTATDYSARGSSSEEGSSSGGGGARFAERVGPSEPTPTGREDRSSSWIPVNAGTPPAIPTLMTSPPRPVDVAATTTSL